MLWYGGGWWNLSTEASIRALEHRSTGERRSLSKVKGACVGGAMEGRGGGVGFKDSRGRRTFVGKCRAGLHQRVSPSPSPLPNP